MSNPINHNAPNSSKIIKIGCASAFWGDTNTAAFQLVHHSDIDYLVSDYLSQITMSIMASARIKDPSMGYAHDFVTRVMTPLIKPIAEKKIKVISNAGGVNPLSCRDALNKIIADAGLNLKVAVVLGDDLMSKQQALRGLGVSEMQTGAALPDNIASMNAYLGASPVQVALDEGADIVITGRVVDSAVVLGPLMHEFGWKTTDYDALAQGSLAGHVIECGAQCTGGNFTDWHLVKDGYSNMGFPIVEVSSDGSFVVTKPEGTSGLVSTATVGEQIVYEIGDPQSYLLPDVLADFSHVTLSQQGENRVLVSGAKGRAPTHQYKVSATYADGYRVLVSFMLGGREASAKGTAVAHAIFEKCERVLNMRGVAGFTSTSVEMLGTETTYGAHARYADNREVVVKMAVTHPLKEACLFFASEIAQAATGMAPGITGIVGGRPKVSPVIKLFSFLVDKDQLNVEVECDGKRQPVAVTASPFHLRSPRARGEIANLDGVNDLIEVPLVQIAYVRSGDKGNHSNLGVIARQPEFLPWIRASLTTSSVAQFMQHVLDDTNSEVLCYELPGFDALNFFLKNALGGGGIASIRIDPQGKALGQQLLDMPVKVPASMLS